MKSQKLPGPQRVSNGKSTSQPALKQEKSSVQVFVRIRPAKESILTNTKTSIQIPNPRNASEEIDYTFPRVFMKESQSEIFNQIKPQLNETFNGRNMTVFAYGQTGSGKTFTINGDASNPGLIPLTIKHLLSERKAKSVKSTFSLAYLEIYNEKIYDLLSSDKGMVDVREIDGQILCVPLTLIEINFFSSFESIHNQAAQRRRTAATNLNQVSSRSHFIMQLTVQTEIGEQLHTSKLHMIDLVYLF